ncbi:hypothetical protein B2J88_35865 [Rhodococcus sp. SRB_17]|nr:hypothetical protein [Rhodococcus sp. SRB_17]
MALGHIAEVVRFGAELGTFLSVLGYAYLGAWIFHLLIVVVPRRRQLFEVYSAAWPALGMIALEGERAVSDLAYLVDPELKADVSPQGMRDLCKRVPVGVITGPHISSDSLKALDILEKRLGAVRDRYQSIVPLIPLFQHGLIVRLTRFAACNLVSRTITQEEIDDEAPLFDIESKRLVRNNLNGKYGHDLGEYVEASLDVHEFLKGLSPQPGPIAYGLHMVWTHKQDYENRKRESQGSTNIAETSETPYPAVEPNTAVPDDQRRDARSDSH